MLETVSNYFYDPVIFWGVPMVLVVAAAVWRKLRVWGLRQLFGRTPGGGPEN